VGKLQTGRFERLAARTYSIKGPGALVDLDETVLGVVLLEREGGMESHLMQQWETFGTWGELGPLSSQFGWFALSNPVGSGRLMVVDSWQRGEDAQVTRAFISRGVPPGFAVAATATALDTRMSTGHQAAGNFFYNQDLSGSFGIVIGESADDTRQHGPWVLAPDGTLLWRSESVNQLISISVRWAEREAAPFEL
jgi:hypothetical protein